MSSYLYYPGCSMESSGRSYRESLEPICEPLGITLDEISDWNCCGATEYVSVSTIPAYSLVARNLAIAAGEKKEGQPLVAACSACYLNLAKTDHYMAEQPKLNASVNDALGAGGLHYDPGSIRVRHLLDVILNDVGLDKVRAAVKKPLAGLKVAPYLGCMVPRPDVDDKFADHEQPNDLDRLLRALGAEVVDYPLKTECCGGHMSQVAPKVGLELIRRLVAEAERREATMMVTVCPMCQINIDAYQGEMNAMFHTKHKMPIVFFTQLMAVAFGLEPKKVGLGREVTNARKALVKALKAAPAQTLAVAGIDAAAGAAPVAAGAPAHRPRPDKRALPMPRMPQMPGMTDSEVEE
jgi:heterodisulfide reductase subunit B